MCGICGVIGLPAEQGRAAAERMARAMVHRGPDDEGFEEMPLTGDPAGPAAAFGFRRLAILDLSPTGHQPMINPATGDVIVFNGEIYNFTEVRARLQLKGHVFRSTGDTEVLLRALAEWGEAALNEWTGLDQLRGGPALASRYWRFPAIDAGAPGGPAAVATTRQLLTESVRLQCVADVPVGVFLSAGIDSATLAALAQPQHGAVHTFSVGFDAPGAEDETALAAETAAMLGTRHFQTIVDDDWAADLFTAWLKSGDRPSIDGLNTFIVSGAAKDRGITVALSGLGADEMFGGYSTFARAAKLKRMLRPLAWLPKSVRRAAAQVAFARLPALKRAKAVEMVARGASPGDLAVFSRRLFLDNGLERLGMVASRLGLTADYLPPEACDAFEVVGDPFHDVSQVEISLYMGNTLLRDSDVNSMAHSLELRVPFLGRKLVNYVCSLPGEVRSPPKSEPKHLLREAMKSRLPEEVFSRPKTGFTLPLDAWMDGRLRSQCEAAVETLASCSLFDAKEVGRLWKELRDPRVDDHWSRRFAFVALGSYLQSLPTTVRA